MALTWLVFNPNRFASEVLAASGAAAAPVPVEDWPPQLRYLATYLERDLGVVHMCVESDYVDRHYMEEFTGYYAKSHQTPPAKCVRLHFFETALSGVELVSPDVLFRAATLEVGTAEAALLQSAYCGFVVVRPLLFAPIGRTVLRHMPATQKTGRNFAASTSRHSVHLGPVGLSVSGSAFQQQDQGVGVCATTAVWSALAGAARLYGQRAPTPMQVSDAAAAIGTGQIRHRATDGLTADQIAGAIEMFGMLVHRFRTLAHDPHSAWAALQVYLSSGIPTVLVLKDCGPESHAVAAVGFSSDSAGGLIELRSFRNTEMLRVLAPRRVYVHDDRLGPYARMSASFPEVDNESSTKEFHLCIEAEKAGEGWAKKSFGSDDWRVSDIIVPLYPKLRLDALGLLTHAGLATDAVQELCDADLRREIRVDARFLMAGDALRDSCVFIASVDEERAVQFASTARLPRWVGEIRVCVAGTEWCRWIVDASDVLRHPTVSLAELAIVCPRTDLRESLRAVLAGHVDNGVRRRIPNMP